MGQIYKFFDKLKDESQKKHKKTPMEFTGVVL